MGTTRSGAGAEILGLHSSKLLSQRPLLLGGSSAFPTVLHYCNPEIMMKVCDEGAGGNSGHLSFSPRRCDDGRALRAHTARGELVPLGERRQASVRTARQGSTLPGKKIPRCSTAHTWRRSRPGPLGVASAGSWCLGALCVVLPLHWRSVHLRLPSRLLLAPAGPAHDNLYADHSARRVWKTLSYFFEAGARVGSPPDPCLVCFWRVLLVQALCHTTRRPATKHPQSIQD